MRLSRPSTSGSPGKSWSTTPSQADRLGAQLAPDERIAGRGRVALVEDQVDHVQDPIETLGQQLGRRDAIRDAGGADLALGADESLRERRLGEQEGTGDLGRGQAAQRPEGQGHPGVHRECRVTAREDESQSIIRDVHGVLRRLRIDGSQRRDRGLASERLDLLGQPAAPAQPIDRTIARRRRDPGSGVVRHPSRRPGFEGGDERVLDCLLGKVEVAEDPDQRGDGPALLLAEQPIDELMSGPRRRPIRRRQSAWPGPSARPRRATPRRRPAGSRSSRASRRGSSPRSGWPRRDRPPRPGRSRRAPPSSPRTGRRS